MTSARGMSLVETLVGIAIMTSVFMGITLSYRLALETVLHSKARIGALSLMSERIEYIRALPYEQVGTVGGIPSGPLVQVSTTSMNGIVYTIRTLVLYRDDVADGVGALDVTGVTADYKDTKVEVTWSIKDSARSVRAVMRTAPRGVETLVAGGTLRVNVFNADAAPVAGASVRVVNTTLIPNIDVTVVSDATGAVLIPGAPVGSNYKITVTKSGYSTAQTYDTTVQNPNPNPANISIVNGQTTTISLAIDQTGSLAVRTFGEEATASQFSIGTSTSASPSAIARWGVVTFASTTSTSTVLGRIYFDTGASMTLVPDSALAGNSAGLTSPIDISSLSTTTYPSLTAVYDDVVDGMLSYRVPPQPIPAVALSVRGSKVIGNTNAGIPIYKYAETPSTDSTGTFTRNPAEWDSYTLGLNGTAYDVVEACPFQTSLSPAGAVTTTFTLRTGTSNSLRAYVTASSTAVSGALVSLTGPASATSTTSACGQAFFGAIPSGSYTVTVSKSGYLNTVDTITVAGDTASTFVLTQ